MLGLALMLALQAGGELVVTPVDAPAEAGGGRYPRLMRGGDGRMVLSWTGRDRSASWLGAAVRSDDGWGPALDVTRGPDGFVNWADFGGVTAAADGSLLGFWPTSLEPGSLSYGTRFALRAADAEAWGESRWLHEDRSGPEYGFVSAVPDGAGWNVLWLDGRRGPKASGAANPAGHGGHGEMSLFLRRLDPSGKAGPEVELDPRVCDCCQTALVRLEDGTLVAAYRDRGEDERRDIAVVRVVDGEVEPPRAVHADGWIVAGCPVNGPVLAADERRVACVWYTEAPGIRVNAAFSDDGGRTFGAPLRVDEGGTLGRVSAAWSADGSLLVSYLEHTDAAQGLGHWRVRRVTPGGELGPPATVAQTETSRASGFLRLLADGEGAWAAWTVRREGGWGLGLARLTPRER